jgi:L-ascorbate metabolism protein UlaG (beta-lactamase superfamily)
VTAIRVTHIGAPTVIIETQGWPILTDPTFDPPGKTYKFGWASKSTKLTGPAIAPDDVEPNDAVLVSHDHHGDNLDDAGRARPHHDGRPNRPPCDGHSQPTRRPLESSASNRTPREPS